MIRTLILTATSALALASAAAQDVYIGNAKVWRVNGLRLALSRPSPASEPLKLAQKTPQMIHALGAQTSLSLCAPLMASTRLPRRSQLPALKASPASRSHPPMVAA